jgi:hypothetical protein
MASNCFGIAEARATLLARNLRQACCAARDAVSLPTEWTYLKPENLIG